MVCGIIAIFFSACIFVCLFNKWKHDAQKGGVCDFSGQGRDEWKEDDQK